MAVSKETSDNVRLILQSVSVDNLRSLQDLQPTPIELDITVLAGQNGGGKTSFIDALWMLLSGKPPSDAARATTSRDITVTGDFRSVDGTETLRVRALHSTGRVRRDLQLLVHRMFGNDPNSMTLQNLREAFDSAGITPPGGAAKAPYVDVAISWIRERPPEEFEETWVSLPPEVERRLPELIVFQSQDADDQPRHVSNLVAGETRRLLEDDVYEPRLNQIAAEIQEDIVPHLDRIKAMIRRYSPEITNVEINANFDFAGVRPQVKMHLTKRGSESIDLNEAGSGLLQRVGIAIYAANLVGLQRTEAASAGTILAYDEPDTHLDYQAQRDLFEIIRGQSRLEHVQVIVATHSINLIDTVRLKSIRHLQLENERTKVDILSDYTIAPEETFIGDLVSGLGMRNSVLLSEKCFLVVEGETEERALRIFFEKVVGDTLAGAGITLINTSGSGGVRRLVEVLIEQLDRSVIVLVDGDARHSPGRINEEWLSAMNLVEGVSAFFAGTKEFEDAFDDYVWLRVARDQFRPKDGSTWQLSDIADVRADDEGMGKALARVFTKRLQNRVSKPMLGEALAHTIMTEEIPEAIRDAISAATTAARNERPDESVDMYSDPVQTALGV